MFNAMDPVIESNVIQCIDAVVQASRDNIVNIPTNIKTPKNLNRRRLKKRSVKTVLCDVSKQNRNRKKNILLQREEGTSAKRTGRRLEPIYKTEVSVHNYNGMENSDIKLRSLPFVPLERITFNTADLHSNNVFIQQVRDANSGNNKSDSKILPAAPKKILRTVLASSHSNTSCPPSRKKKNSIVRNQRSNRSALSSAQLDSDYTMKNNMVSLHTSTMVSLEPVDSKYYSSVVEVSDTKVLPRSLVGELKLTNLDPSAINDDCKTNGLCSHLHKNGDISYENKLISELDLCDSSNMGDVRPMEGQQDNSKHNWESCCGSAPSNLSNMKDEIKRDNSAMDNFFISEFSDQFDMENRDYVHLPSEVQKNTMDFAKKCGSQPQYINTDYLMTKNKFDSDQASSISENPSPHAGTYGNLLITKVYSLVDMGDVEMCSATQDQEGNLIKHSPVNCNNSRIAFVRSSSALSNSSAGNSATSSNHKFIDSNYIKEINDKQCNKIRPVDQIVQPTRRFRLLRRHFKDFEYFRKHLKTISNIFKLKIKKITSHHPLFTNRELLNSTDLDLDIVTMSVLSSSGTFHYLTSNQVRTVESTPCIPHLTTTKVFSNPERSLELKSNLQSSCSIPKQNIAVQKVVIPQESIESKDVFDLRETISPRLIPNATRLNVNSQFEVKRPPTRPYRGISSFSTPNPWTAYCHPRRPSTNISEIEDDTISLFAESTTFGRDNSPVPESSDDEEYYDAFPNTNMDNICPVTYSTVNEVRKYKSVNIGSHDVSKRLGGKTTSNRVEKNPVTVINNIPVATSTTTSNRVERKPALLTNHLPVPTTSETMISSPKMVEPLTNTINTSAINSDKLSVNLIPSSNTEITHDEQEIVPQIPTSISKLRERNNILQKRKYKKLLGRKLNVMNTKYKVTNICRQKARMRLLKGNGVKRNARLEAETEAPVKETFSELDADKLLTKLTHKTSSNVVEKQEIASKCENNSPSFIQPVSGIPIDVHSFTTKTSIGTFSPNSDTISKTDVLEKSINDNVTIMPILPKSRIAACNQSKNSVACEIKNNLLEPNPSPSLISTENLTEKSSSASSTQVNNNNSTQGQAVSKLTDNSIVKPLQIMFNELQKLQSPCIFDFVHNFRYVCIEFLKLGGCKNGKCQFTHTLPREFEKIVKKCNRREILHLFTQFFKNFNYLLQSEFYIIVKCLGRMGCRGEILQMAKTVKESLSSVEKLSQITAIVEALGDTYMESREALEQLITIFGASNLTMLDVLLEMILQEGYIEHNWQLIQKLTQVFGYEMSLEHVEIILKDCCKQKRRRRYYVHNVYKDVIMKVADINLTKLSKEVCKFIVSLEAVDLKEEAVKLKERIRIITLPDMSQISANTVEEVQMPPPLAAVNFKVPPPPLPLHPTPPKIANAQGSNYLRTSPQHIISTDRCIRPLGLPHASYGIQQQPTSFKGSQEHRDFNHFHNVSRASPFIHKQGSDLHRPFRGGPQRHRSVFYNPHIPPPPSTSVQFNDGNMPHYNSNYVHRTVTEEVPKVTNTPSPEIPKWTVENPASPLDSDLRRSHRALENGDIQTALAILMKYHSRTDIRSIINSVVSGINSHETIQKISHLIKQ